MASRLRQRRARRYRPSAAPSGVRRLSRPHIEIDRGLAWFVIWTAARAEAKIAAALAAAGLAAYVPTEAVAVIRRGREVEVDRPAISRYVFVGLHAAHPEWQAVRKALEGPFGWLAALPLLGRVLTCADGMPLSVPPAALQRLADGLTLDDTRQPRLAAGGACKAILGPFAGFKGIIQSSDDIRVRALLDVFGRQTSVEFDLDQLEAA